MESVGVREERGRLRERDERKAIILRSSDIELKIYKPFFLHQQPEDTRQKGQASIACAAEVPVHFHQ